jgi:hypothetical protein
MARRRPPPNPRGNMSYCAMCGRGFRLRELLPQAFGVNEGPFPIVAVCGSCTQQNAGSLREISLAEQRKIRSELRVRPTTVVASGHRCAFCRSGFTRAELTLARYKPPDGPSVLTAVCPTCRGKYVNRLAYLDPRQDPARRLDLGLRREDLKQAHRTALNGSGRDEGSKPERITRVVSAGLPGLGKRRK